LATQGQLSPRGRFGQLGKLLSDTGRKCETGPLCCMPLLNAIRGASQSFGYDQYRLPSHNTSLYMWRDWAIGAQMSYLEDSPGARICIEDARMPFLVCTVAAHAVCPGATKWI